MQRAAQPKYVVVPRSRDKRSDLCIYYWFPILQHNIAELAGNRQYSSFVYTKIILLHRSLVNDECISIKLHTCYMYIYWYLVVSEQEVRSIKRNRFRPSSSFHTQLTPNNNNINTIRHCRSKRITKTCDRCVMLLHIVASGQNAAERTHMCTHTKCVQGVARFTVISKAQSATTHYTYIRMYIGIYEHKHHANT